MIRKLLAGAWPSLLLMLCIKIWSGCASQGGAPTGPADLTSPPTADLADAGVTSDLKPDKSLLWLKQIPSSTSVDLARQLAVDKSGNVFVACQFSGPMDFGDGPRSPQGNHDIALVKLTAAGDFVWVRQFGNANEETVLRLVVDGNGNVIIAGTFSDTINFGAGPLTSNGREDFYLAKYEGDGRLAWAKAFGTPTVDSSYAGLAVDDGGNIYFAGPYGLGLMNATIDLGGGPLMANGYTDSFLAKFDASGAHVFSKRFGGIGHDYIISLALDKGGDIVIGGALFGTVDLGGGPIDPGGPGIAWGAVARFTSSGVYKWAIGYFSNGARVTDVAVDETGAIAVGGSYSVMLQTRTTSLSSPPGRTHGFLLQLDAAGSEKWARGAAAGSISDTNMALLVDSSRIYVGGMFEGSANFGSTSRTAAGGSDGYLSAFSLAGAPQWVRTFGGPEDDFLQTIARSADAIYGGGTFVLTADFGGAVLTSKGIEDGFVVKLLPTPPAIP